MAMGDYDESEHERRERKAGSIDVDFSDDRSAFEGKMTVDAGGTAEELLDKFNEIKGH